MPGELPLTLERHHKNTLHYGQQGFGPVPVDEKRQPGVHSTLKPNKEWGGKGYCK